MIFIRQTLSARVLIQLIARPGNKMASFHNGTVKCGDENDLEYEEVVRTLNTLQTNAALLQDMARRARRSPEAQARNVEDTAKFLSSDDQEEVSVFVVRMRTALEWLEAVCCRCGVEMQQLDDLCVIHVAGTKGKGSTCAFCESVLRQHGFKTGFFSSPHLVAVRERIRINGRPLAREHFTHHFWRVYNALNMAKENGDDMPAYFKFLTVMAFSVFLAEKVDVAIVEVGIGGEYDCTNVLRRVSTVGITSLGIDHVKVLGHTVEEIAWQKAGIMKPGAVAFTASQQPEAALKVLKERAKERQCPLLVAPPLENYDWGQFPVELGINSPTQVINASLALQLANTWMLLRSTKNAVKKPVSFSECGSFILSNEHKSGWPITTASTFPITQDIALGLKQCSWPGRTQVLDKGHVCFFLDGAHTAESMLLCSNWFSQASRRHDESRGDVARRVLLFNSTGDRDAAVLLSPLLQCGFTHVFFCPNLVTEHTDMSSDQTNRTVTGEQVMERCRLNEETWQLLGGGGEVKQFGCVLAALTHLQEDCERAHVLVTGSLHLVGGMLSLIDPELALSMQHSSSPQSA